MRQERRAPADPDLQTGLQWGIGCLVGGAALTGGAILVVLVSIAAEPPAWLQILLGLALVGGAICLSWLFTMALRRSHDNAARRSIASVDPPEDATSRRPSNG